MTLQFAVTWDYRCPFARNGHEHVVAALQGGADWEVRFVPFSLNQVHVEEGQPDVWDDPEKAPALLAMQAGIAVRDAFPDAFLPVHLDLFRARHDDAKDIREESVVRTVLARHLDADAVFDEIASGRPLATFRREHEEVVESHDVFGVPTFIAGDQAVFVRVMHRPGEDRESGRRTIERVIDLLTGWTDLNEFKRTRIPR
jgi:predicted DsbA family dithiol-disulfide isomerase